MFPIIFTIDAEDWYHGIPIPIETWGNRKKRLEIGINHLIELLNERQKKATFFVLGAAIRTNPDLFRIIANEGHEIACHGMNHQLVYTLSPEEFRKDIQDSKSLIEDITGVEIIGYRAPYFSITQKSIWALDILAELGFKYDSSISATKSWRYGIENARSSPYYLADNGLWEIPVSQLKWTSLKFNFGGAYLRILKSICLTKASQQSKTEKPIFYIHPWEYDPNHPFSFFNPKAMVTHYWDLRSTYGLTKRLLDEHQTQRMCDYYSELKDQGSTN